MYIGLDIGTSSVKGVLATDTGEIIKTGTWGRAIFVTFVIDTLTKIC